MEWLCCVCGWTKKIEQNLWSEAEAFYGERPVCKFCGAFGGAVVLVQTSTEKLLKVE